MNYIEFLKDVFDISKTAKDLLKTIGFLVLLCCVVLIPIGILSGISSWFLLLMFPGIFFVFTYSLYFSEKHGWVVQ